jgi:hypothetical protein
MSTFRIACAADEIRKTSLSAATMRRFTLLMSAFSKKIKNRARTACYSGIGANLKLTYRSNGQ